MSAQETLRTGLIKELQLMLGDKMTDIDLEPEHYNTAINIALDRFRQRSSGSVDDSHVFLALQPDKQVYILPQEVQDVKAIYRRGVGSNTAGGTNFNPFEAGFANTYLLQSGKTGGLVSWDFFAQYQETAGRLFGSALNFNWSFPERKLTIIRKILSEETVLIQCFNQRPEIALLSDVYSKPWIREYALAWCKIMLGEARGKFTSGLPGPGGNVTLNGTELKQEGQATLDRLEQEIKDFVTSQYGWPFLIG